MLIHFTLLVNKDHVLHFSVRYSIYLLIQIVKKVQMNSYWRLPSNNLMKLDCRKRCTKRRKQRHQNKKEGNDSFHFIKMTICLNECKNVRPSVITGGLKICSEWNPWTNSSIRNAKFLVHTTYGERCFKDDIAQKKEAKRIEVMTQA